MVGILEQALHHLEGIDDLDQAGIVIVEAARDRAGFLKHVELGERHVGIGCAAGIDVVETCKGSDAIDPFGIALRLVVGELHIAEVLDRLADQTLVLVRRHHVFEDAALGILESQEAVVVLQVPLGLTRLRNMVG
jgi:hypothetical protein